MNRITSRFVPIARRRTKFHFFAWQQSAMTIKAAILGYGFSGRSFHRYLISKESRIVVHGVFARRPEVHEQIKSDLPQALIYTELDQVLEDKDVDLVVVATATNTHFEFSSRALKAGKHVVVGACESHY
jgi:predicted dehydrogenase